MKKGNLENQKAFDKLKNSSMENQKAFGWMKKVV